MAVDYEKEGRIAIITLNRPEALNALNAQAIQELHEAMVDFRDDPDLWVGIVTGTGRAFSAGADIKEMRPGQVKENPPTPMRGLDIWKPLIAAINGLALGGGLEIALACDIRIASENARLGLPEVRNVNLIPGLGGTQRLPRFIPRAFAAEMLLTGKQIDAQEAYRMGLVNKVVPPEQLMSTAREWAGLICEAGPLGVRAAKESMIRGCNMSLEEGLRLERLLGNPLRETEDFNEATTAFKEKRRPVYKGK